MLAQRLPLKTYQYVTWINAGQARGSLRHDLYANLRALDKAGCARILVQEVPGDERWDAVRDRLSRAAGARCDSGHYAAAGHRRAAVKRRLHRSVRTCAGPHGWWPPTVRRC